MARGLPDRDSLSSYGGAMQNYAEPVDPTTDEDAAHRNLYAMNVAAMTHSATRAARSFLGTTGGGTAIADPSSGFIHDAVWGDTSDVKPSVTHVATGTYDAIWPSTVNDELNESHTLNVRRAWAGVESPDGTLMLAEAKRMGAQKVRVYTYKANASGQLFLDELAGQTITVFWL